MQQLFKLTLFELSIVSDIVECVRFHNLPVLKDCVQQVLEKNRKEDKGEGEGEGEGEREGEGEGKVKEKGGNRKCEGEC